MAYPLAILVIIMMAIGQILFKLIANAAGTSETGLMVFFRKDIISIFIVSLILYFSATVLWILVLRDLALNRAYPIMALSYLLVPVGCYFIFNEKLGFGQMAGSILIVCGVILSARY